MGQHRRFRRSGSACLCAVACAVGAGGLADPGVASTRLPTYRSPAYHGAHPIPATLPPVPPKPTPLSASGRFPNVFVDHAGTSHIVWVEDGTTGPDVVHYCRLKRAQTSCDNPAASQALTPQKEYGDGDDPRFNVSTDGARILQVGQEIVILDYRYPTVYLKPDGSDQSRTVLEWVSEDGGNSFTGPALAGNQSINGGVVEFGPDTHPTLLTTTDTVTGGTFVQAIAPGQYSGDSANLAADAPDGAYSGSLALDGGLPVAAFANLSDQSLVRRWTGSGSPADAATWGPPSVVPGDEPKLAGGPSGLFLMNRPAGNKPYVVRRLSGATVGSPATVSDANDAVRRDFIQTSSGSFVAAWESRAGKTPGVRMTTSNDGNTWSSPAPLIAAPDAGQISLGAAGDGGGVAVVNRTGAVNAAGPIVALAYGQRAPTGEPGIAGIAGGGDPTQSTSCTTVTFGVVKANSAAGCFLHGTGAAAGQVVSDGELNLNGLRIVPDRGVQILIDPRAHVLTTTGAVRVMLVGGGVDITLWHGPLHVELPLAGSGQTLFSFDTSQFPVDLAGFGIDGRIDVILTPNGVRVPIALKLPPVFGDVRGNAELVADQATGLHLTSLHIHVGNILLGPLLIDHIDLDYSGDGNVWKGDGKVIFPPAGLGGALGASVEFDNGAFKHGGLVYEPPPPGIVIGPFVYINSIDGELDLDPTHIGAGARIGAGTPGVDGVSPVNVDGHFDMTFPSSPKPDDFKMSGALSFFIIPVARGYLDFTSDGYASFGGEANLTLGPLYVGGNTDGFVDATSGQFGAAISGDVGLQVSVLGQDFSIGLGIDAAVSNAGFAACGKVDIPELFPPFKTIHVTGGVEFPWKDIGPETLANPVLLQIALLTHLHVSVAGIGNACTTDAYRVAPRPPGAAAAQAGVTTVQIPKGLPSETILLVGDGGAPAATVTGPGGATVGGSGPQAGYALTPKGFQATYVVLDHPAAGTWTVTPQPGSPSISKVMLADGYAQATVAAHLGGRGRARTIDYRITNRGHGQTVSFAERGTFGTRVIGAARSARGTLRFAPADARGGRRTVLAFISHDGIVVRRVTLGSYLAPGPRSPARVGHARAHAGRRGLALTWSPVSGAAQYVIHVSGSHGMRRLFVVSSKTHRFRVAAAAPGDRLSATIAARDRSGRTGPSVPLR